MVSALRVLQRFIPLIAIGFLLLAVALARHQFNGYHISRIGDLILAVPAEAIAQGIVLMIGGYLAATTYDRLALRYIGKQLSLGKTLLTAFISFAVSHNAGHPLVSGTSLRYRFYPNWGITGIEILKIALVDSITYGLGLATILILAYSMVPSAEDLLPLPAVNPAVLLIIVAYIAYWICVTWWRPVIHIKGVRFRFPDCYLTLAQIAIGSAEVFCSGMVLHTLLESMVTIPLSEFFIIYILSLILGTFSQLPGGIGIFEGMFLHMMSVQYPDADVIAALVLYRIIYYFLPLGLAGLLLLGYELKNQRIGLYRLTCNTFKRLYHH